MWRLDGDPKAYQGHVVMEPDARMDLEEYDRAVRRAGWEWVKLSLWKEKGGFRWR